ncbi:MULTISPECIES: peptide-methionine (S)-S-oxide reductase MsrA [Corynebacterium]|nr:MULTISPECIES: peptide-methionine (S)-S-oxide reductase MsrA [Corynebacterium]
MDRFAALNSKGPWRAPRMGKEKALKGGRHPVLDVTAGSGSAAGSGSPVAHAVLGTPLGGAEQFRESCPDAQELILGAGCFWGVERLYWSIDGVLGTSVGYAGGWTANPTYREVCTGRTDHAEVVRVVFNPATVSVEELLQVMFENHDPTLGDRQGNDVGSQYRSCVFASDDAQLARVEAAVQAWAPRFVKAGLGEVTTETSLMSTAGDGHYYLAEIEHQQYLHKNPGGYCNHGPNGVSCPTGVL